MDQNIRLAVDAIVFGYRSNTLYVLLIKQKYGVQKNNWVLPGGFVKDDEALSEAVRRELKEEAGIEVNYLEQLYTFGDDIHRDERFRVVSVAYFALADPAKFSLKADTDAEDAQWFPVSEIPKLGYDHTSIIKVAHERLKAKLSYQPIGFDLLDKEFLFSELETLYCTILESEIDRRNFRKKILSFGIVDETRKTATQSAGRPGKLFRFNKKKYNALVKDGFHFEIYLRK
jgi:8-oxo-dGTP diphosphatase